MTHHDDYSFTKEFAEWRIGCDTWDAGSSDQPGGWSPSTKNPNFVLS